MRMDRLLADIEAAAAANTAAESRAEVAEGVRAEQALVTLPDRLRASRGRTISVGVGTDAVSGTLVDVGEGWLAIDRRMRGLVCLGLEDLVRPGVVVVAVDAVSTVSGIGRAHEGDAESSIGRTWGSLLRAVARARVPVAWHLRDGQEPQIGLIDAVGADHVLVRGGSAPSSVVVAVRIPALTWLDLCAPRER